MAAEGASQLISVVTLLGAAIIAVPLFKKLGLGSVLGYLAAGLVVGPFGLKLFTDPQSIIHVAELGVVMFLFIIGLEMKPSHLWGLRRQIFGLGSLQVISCAIFLTFVGMLFGFPWQVAFISASGFVLTSTAIVMQVLGERGDINAPRGQKMVSILLFEDLIIVPLLAVVAFLAPTNPDVAVVTSQPIWQKIGIAGLSLAALVVAGLWLLNPLFRIVAKTKVRELMTAVALFVVLGSALLMEEGGLSTAMGAFAAGVLLSESSFRHQLEADIEPFRGLLLGLFFLGVGMALDLNVVMNNWMLIVSGVIALMVVKSIAIYVIARLSKSSHMEAMDRAVLMAQGGEFAFVLYAAATSQGVLDAETNANITAIVVLSMVITPINIVIHNKFIVPRFTTEEQREADQIEEQRSIVLIGIGRFGQIINHVLTMSGYHPTVIDLDAQMINNLKKLGIKSYYGDATRMDILHNAGVEHAELLIVAVDNQDAAITIVKAARHMNPNIKIIARAYDRPHVYQLFQAGADLQVRETFDSALRSSKKALRILGIDKDVAEEVCRHYFYRDRHRVKVMAEYYDPKVDGFKNADMMKVALEEDQITMMEIQNILERAKNNS
ncbi:monovalent cation:proton antiporter-2 (CPA2) family protein [Glaesserella sp.]|uniref:monovalent cation:proton antiporter-2 (CPA2) family protein n=1 Tax=Glaesserella sp. TaxID=2094731 RepID=UPI00359FF127